MDAYRLRRRDLARTVLLGAAATAIPAAARAADMGSTENIIFTKADPAHWAGKEGTHVPLATVSGSTLTVTTPHPMTDEHFIVSHTVVLEGGKYLSRATFTSKDKPTSTHNLPAGYKGVVTVTSACNLHDLWSSTVTV
jgi:superoxide reductase